MGTVVLASLCQKGLCRPLRAATTADVATSGSRQRQLSQQNAAGPLCRKPSRHDAPHGRAGGQLPPPRPVCTELGPALGARPGPGFRSQAETRVRCDIPSSPFVSRGLSCNLQKGLGPPTPLPQQQHPRSPSALTGDSTGKGTGEPTPVLECRGVPEENKSVVSDNHGHTVCRGLVALTLPGLLPPRRVSCGAPAVAGGGTGAPLPPRPLGSQELPDQCILPRQPAPLFFTQQK